MGVSRLEERFIDNTDGAVVRARKRLSGDFPVPGVLLSGRSSRRMKFSWN